MNPLYKHALENVCNVPDRGFQKITKPARVSPNGGYIRVARVGWLSVKLPSTNTNWHIYQFGNMHPKMLNLPEVTEGWKLLSEACYEARCDVQIYNLAGITFPRISTYYTRLSDNNLIFAVEINNKFSTKMDTEDLFFRFYANPYHFGIESTGDGMAVLGAKMLNTQDILLKQVELEFLGSISTTRPEAVCAFVNGKHTNFINIINTKVGDTVEIVQDKSMYRIMEYPLNNIKTFVSERDLKHKWLLDSQGLWGYLNNVSDLTTTVDFNANVDLYVRDNATGFSRYVNKNAVDTLRSVTFRDFSVTTDYVTSLLDYFKSPTDGTINYDNLTLICKVRVDGMSPPLFHDINKSDYMTHLSAQQVEGALLGSDSSNLHWRAAHLENSAIIRLMETRIENITPDLVYQAYGYSASNKVLADAVIPTQEIEGDISQRTYATTPLMERFRSTTYMYSAEGKLVGYQVNEPIISNALYVPGNVMTVEIIKGRPSNGLAYSEFFDTQRKTVTPEFSLEITPGYDWRGFAKYPSGWVRMGSAPTTGKAAFVQKTGDLVELKYLGDPQLIPAIEKPTDYVLLSDEGHLFYEVSLRPNDGILAHTLELAYLKTINSNSVASSEAMPIPMANLDIWLNDHPLAKDIDYRLKGNTILILSKKFLRPREEFQKLSIRAFGFCTDALQWRTQSQSGFVFNGTISKDGLFGLRKHKSIRLAHNGTLVPLKDAMNAETSPSSGLLTNGLPYEIKEPMNNLRGFAPSLDTDGYLLSEQEQLIDAEVSTYLTDKVDEPSLPLSVFQDKYGLYSPFLGKVLYALQNNNISSANIQGNYDDNKVRALIQPYLWLYEYDPCNAVHDTNMVYCEIIPHWFDTAVPVTQEQYRFLTNVVRLFGNNRVILSGHLQVQ